MPRPDHVASSGASWAESPQHSSAREGRGRRASAGRAPPTPTCELAQLCADCQQAGAVHPPSSKQPRGGWGPQDHRLPGAQTTCCGAARAPTPAWGSQRDKSPEDAEGPETKLPARPPAPAPRLSFAYCKLPTSSGRVPCPLVPRSPAGPCQPAAPPAGCQQCSLICDSQQPLTWSASCPPGPPPAASGLSASRLALSRAHPRPSPLPSR